MENVYKKLLEIKGKSNEAAFNVVCTYIFDIGYQAAKEITDEDIENAKGDGFATKEFNQWVMRTAREVVNIINNNVELVQFCAVEDVYDTRFFADKLPRWQLEDMLKTRISMEDYTRTDTTDYIIYLCDRYDCDAEDLEYLGIEIPDEYWEEV